MFCRLCSRALWMPMELARRMAARQPVCDLRTRRLRLRFAGIGHCSAVRFVLAQRLAGVRRRMRHHLRRRAGDDDLAARVAALGAEIDDPVGGADHVEVVLDDHQRMAGRRAAGGTRAAAWRRRRSAGRWSARRTGTACRGSTACRRPRLRPGARRASGAAPRRPRASAPAGRAAGTRGRRRPAAAGARATVDGPEEAPAPR